MDTKHMVKLQGNVIETTVTCKASVVNEWIRDVKSTAHCFQNIVGVDRQYNQSDYSDETALLQICIGTKCLLYQPVNDTPLSYKNFFRDQSLIFVGVDVAERMIGSDFDSTPQTKIDIEALAVERWCWPRQGIRWKPGLKVLARSVAGLNIERPPHVMYSNWFTRKLSVEQIEYACIDVFAAFRIGTELLKHGNGMQNMMKLKSEDDDED